MSHDDQPSNPSNNRPFDDVLAARLHRRTVLVGGVAVAATSFLATSPVGATRNPSGIGASTRSDVDGDTQEVDSNGDTANNNESAKNSEGHGDGNGHNLIGFEPLPLHFGPAPAVSPDYQISVLAPWGTPLRKGAAEFSYPPTSAANQEVQVGIGHDGMKFFPTGRGKNRNRKGLLCLNHEFGRNTHVLGKELPESHEEVRISQAAHGISVIRIRQTQHGQWEVAPGGKSRRITVNTPVKFKGPAAHSHLLKTPAGDAPTGTLNNCANGYTPWGTYLTCEENFNGYYGATGDWTPTAAQERYGFSETGFGYGWEAFDPRFDLSNADFANAENRYGWVVEIDPNRRRSKPVKRTALGRFKHEGVALTIGKGNRAVAYMGDDQRFDYIYKFVSDDNYRKMLRQGRSPLDEGKLYAARFDDDGTGEWLELTIDNPDIAAAFSDQAEVLTYARMAADIVGATPMDRAEWTTVAPNGHVYCSLTNNTKRETPNAANPQAPNPNGHIIRWRDSKRHIGTTFDWDIFLLASSTEGTDDGFGSPDGIWADPDGRIFIQTDGAQPDGANDQMLVADPKTGELRRIFGGVAGAEVTGITVTPDRRTMFINLQHPGNGDPAITLFPDFDGGVVPRDATIILSRKDGGIIGS